MAYNGTLIEVMPIRSIGMGDGEGGGGGGRMKRDGDGGLRWHFIFLAPSFRPRLIGTDTSDSSFAGRCSHLRCAVLLVTLRSSMTRG